jgi:hypothetical protein
MTRRCPLGRQHDSRWKKCKLLTYREILMKCIHPNTINVFNMPADAAQQMFEEDPPSKLIVPVILARAGRTIREAASTEWFRQIVQPVLQQSELSPAAFGLKTEVEYVIFVDDNPPRLWLCQREELAKWELSLGFLQSGLVNPDKLGNAPIPYQEVCTNMCLYDAAVCSGNSFEPRDLQPMQVCKFGHDDFVRSVDGLYERRVCVMHRSLVPFRTAILVATHATLCGLDGIVELKKFQAGNGLCHLQYRGSDA